MENLWPQLACGQVLEGAKACAEILGRQAALAVEFAQKIFGRAVALLRVAVQAAGDQIAAKVGNVRRSGRRVAPKTKSPDQRSGRTFLRPLAYYISTSLVK